MSKLSAFLLVILILLLSPPVLDLSFATPPRRGTKELYQARPAALFAARTNLHTVRMRD
jgi:hypothetical protein